MGLGIVDASYRRRLLGINDDAATDSNDDDDESVQNLLLYYKVLSFSRWNSTARPCSSLARAAITGRTVQNMSIMDVETLRTCVERRQLGRDIILELNLTSVAAQNYDDHDGDSNNNLNAEENEVNRMFMSLEDFSSVVSSRYLTPPPHFHENVFAKVFRHF